MEALTQVSLTRRAAPVPKGKHKPGKHEDPEHRQFNWDVWTGDTDGVRAEIDPDGQAGRWQVPTPLQPPFAAESVDDLLGV